MIWQDIEITQGVALRSRRRFHAIADKLEADPSLLSIPLENIRRWAAAGHSHARWHEQWRRLLSEARESPEALHRLTARLRNDEYDELKGFEPFVGLLAPDEVPVLT